MNTKEDFIEKYAHSQTIASSDEFINELDELLASEFKEGYDKGWKDRGWTIRNNKVTFE